MFPALKKALTPTSLLGQSQGSEVDSYGDSYFREIGFKIGENSFVGSTESPDQDGQEVLDHVDLDLPQDSGLANYSVPDTASSKRSRVKSKKHHRLTMADAYGTPSHLFPHKAYTSDPRSTDRSLRYGGIDEYAITLRKNTSDELTISTLGEESIKRKPSPLYAQQLYNATHQQSFVKPPIRHQIEALDLKQTSTGSTLEERPSEDSRDRASQHRRSSPLPGDAGQPKKRWGLIYFVFGSALIMLAAASVVLGVTLMQWMSQGQSDESGEEHASTWAPRYPEGWGNFSTDESAPDPIELAREDLLQIIATVSPNTLSYISDVTTPQSRAFDWTVQDSNYFGYSIDRLVQRWSMAVIFVSLGKGSSLTMDAHECLWYSTDVDEVCDENGNIVALHLSNSGLYGTIPPEVALLSATLKRMHLPSNNITGTLPSEIGNLTNLVRLQLDSNMLEGTIPSEIARLSNLVIFSLGQNRMSGTIPSDFGNLGRLASLVLEGNKLQGYIPSQLGNMQSLEILNLETNHLNGTLPTELGSLQHLNFLSLHQNEIEGSMPDEVCMNHEQNSQLVIAADCAEVDCSCCALCCMDCEGESAGVLVTLPSGSKTNETNFPSPAPTSVPSNSPPSTTNAPTVLDDQQNTFTPTQVRSDPPSSSPTESNLCSSKLTVNKTCFVQNKGFLQVQFENCEATGADWIGVFADEYLTTNPLAGLVEPKDKAEVWTRPCGDRDCSTPVTEGSVSLGSANLETGKYIMVLMREGAKVATSRTFEIRQQCN